jgi:flavin-dependent dehydrogenase
MDSRPVVIVGSGPGGVATALHLQRKDPALAAETLVIEKARHPRFKVCAGGLLPHAVSCLEDLGLGLEVPHVAVHRAQVRTPRCTVTHDEHNLCYVIRRAEFDAYLAAACRARGVEIHEEESVIDVRRDGAGIRVVTDRGEYQTRLLVGADGSGSLVRRRLVDPLKGHVARAIMCDVPVEHTAWDGFQAQRYEFDFRLVRRGLQGYCWAFPCLIDGVPHVNVGVYAWRQVGLDLHDALTEYLEEMTRMRPRRRAFPVHWYEPGRRLAAPHVLLVGDAAGADPLMGEGISLALQYGAFAGAAVQEAFRTGDFSGVAYQQAIERSWFGRKLRRLHLGARLFYGSLGRACFFLAEESARMRALGLRWYNGVDGWDRRGGWDAVRAVIFNDLDRKDAPKQT